MATINLRQNPSNSGGLTNVQIDTNFNNLNIDSLTRAPSGVVWTSTTAVVKGAILFVVDNTNATTTGSTIRHYLVTIAGTTTTTAPSHTTGSASNGTATLDFIASSGVFNGIEVLAKLNQIGNINITGGQLAVGPNGNAADYLIGVGKSHSSAYASSSSSLYSPTQGGAAAAIDIFNSANLDSSAAYLNFRTSNTNGSANWAYIGNISTTGSLSPSIVFGVRTGATAYAERMRIDSSGNVGIGTTSPSNSAKLDVNGSVISTNATLGSFNANNAGFDFIAASKIGRFYATSTDTTGGVMTFTTGQNGSYVERMRIDSSGNLGLNVTPSITGGTFKSFEITGRGAGILSNGSNRIELVTNLYTDGSNYVYVGSNLAARYTQSVGTHSWQTAASGTANTTTIVSGQAYGVASLGSSTLANWQSFFSGLVSIPTVGQTITATASGTLLGGGTVSQLASLTTIMTLDTSGNIGLGGTVGIGGINSLGTGLTTMEIRGNNGGGLRISNNGPTTVATIYANATKLYMTSTGGLDATFFADSYIQTAGGIGIGVSTSTAISTYSNITNALVVAGSPTANNGNIVAFSTAALAADIGGLITLGATDGGVPRVYAGLKAGKLNATSGDYSGYLDLQTRNNGAFLATVMRLNNNGTVGVGTSFALAPTSIATLDVGGGSATTYTDSSASAINPSGQLFNIRNTNATVGNGVFQTFYTTASTNQWYQGAVDAASFGGFFVLGNRTGSTAYQERFRVSAVGTVTAVTGSFVSTKTGTSTDATGQIYLNGTTSNRIDFNTNGLAAPAFTTRSAGTKIVLYPAVAAAAVDYGIGVETGNVWFSTPTTSTGFKWYGGTTLAMTLTGAGALTATGNITAFSDARLKKDVVTIDNALEKTLQLRGVYFTRNDIVDAKREVGVIAQEVQKIVPELVRESEDGTLSVAYGNAIAILIESVKELNAKIDALDARMNK